MSDEKLSELGRDLVEAMQEVTAHTRGKSELPMRIARVPDSVDVGTIRRRLNLSQRRFAERFGFTLSAVREWEQGRRRPDRSARVLLKVIDRDHEAVERALAAT
ncbi:MAG: type II toxin-antitoxin system MqsA family antitoxin [Acidobacteriota bacterium]